MSVPNVAIIDYGMGNLFSVARAVEYCGAHVTITHDPSLILSASHVILPGVGAFARAMQFLQHYELVDVIKTVVLRGTPFLGICLGMQLLFGESEEFGLSAGLNLIPGRVIPVPKLSLVGLPLKVPHIGWSSLVYPTRGSSSWEDTILREIVSGDSLYFVHSYMGVVIDSRHLLAECQYADQQIPAVVQNGNLVGCQFHPEKSGKIGLKILENFVFK